MRENKEEKSTVRSFRVSDDVMTKFKNIQDELRLTQDGALKALVASYEMENAKSALPERELEISNFQAKANELIDAYLFSLQLNSDAEARIMSQYEMQLKAKDKTIELLNGKLNEMLEHNNKYPELQEALLNTKKQLEQAKQIIRSMESDQKLTTERLQFEKEKAITELQLEYEKNKNAEIQALRDTIDKLKEERYALLEENRALKYGNPQTPKHHVRH